MKNKNDALRTKKQLWCWKGKEEEVATRRKKEHEGQYSRFSGIGLILIKSQLMTMQKQHP